MPASFKWRQERTTREEYNQVLRRTEGDSGFEQVAGN
jgi:hypothetical protein